MESKRKQKQQQQQQQQKKKKKKCFIPSPFQIISIGKIYTD